MVRIGLVGEGRSEIADLRGPLAFRRQHVEGNDVLVPILLQAQAIDAAARIARYFEFEIRFPAAVVKIILVEMDGCIVARRVTPRHVRAVPARPAYRARRRIDKPSMQAIRTTIDDRQAFDTLREIPPGAKAGGRMRIGFRWRGAIIRQPLVKGRILQPPIEMIT